jgi:hypothetical protein
MDSTNKNYIPYTRNYDDPNKIAKRGANKYTGRKLIRRLGFMTCLIWVSL